MITNHQQPEPLSAGYSIWSAGKMWHRIVYAESPLEAIEMIEHQQEAIRSQAIDETLEEVAISLEGMKVETVAGECVIVGQFGKRLADQFRAMKTTGESK